ncbi:hypothetical protein TWF173_010024 [Orbilia oligospora]|nr:hypothetical protein TWF173_010024 [Orbilia oligospora]
MTQHRSGHGFDSIKIGTSRAKFLIHLLSPVSIFRLYNVLLLSKSEVPDRILLSILHALSEAGMFVQALQVFQKLALSPSRNDKSLSLRKWQFRRLFLKLYRAGIPIHESDVISFFSSFGNMDPLIYKLLIYAAAGVNDANSVHKLTKDHENQTGAALPLDVVSADGCREFRGLETASEHFVACIVSAVARYKPNLGLALGIVQDMIDFSDLPHPTSLTWDSLLQASTLHRDPDTSEKIWEAMLEHGIPPTTHTYSAMIMLYATVGDREKSDIIRYRITQEGWALTPHLRNALEVAERKLTYRIVRRVEGTEN